MSELVIEWLKGAEKATITAASGTKLKNTLIKLAKKFPDECDYIENEDGSVMGHVPTKFVKVKAPKQMSEETRSKLSDLLAKNRANSALNVSDEDL